MSELERQVADVLTQLQDMRNSLDKVLQGQKDVLKALGSPTPKGYENWTDALNAAFKRAETSAKTWKHRTAGLGDLEREGELLSQTSCVLHNAHVLRHLTTSLVEAAYRPLEDANTDVAVFVDRAMYQALRDTFWTQDTKGIVSSVVGFFWQGIAFVRDDRVYRNEVWLAQTNGDKTAFILDVMDD